MRRTSTFAAAALAMALGCGADPAQAQQCSVFTDVFITDSFCPAVQWLRNRNITLGCTATAYCPGNSVTRAQMALFMNRLGIALTPRIVSFQQGTGTGSNIAPALSAWRST